MLCRSAREIPHGRAWRHEPKWDGFRAIAARTNSGAGLRSRRGADLGARFPEVVAALEEALSPGTVLDGELVGIGQRGLEFGGLCRRLSGASAPVETLYVAFDALEVDGRDCRSLPLRERRALLMLAIGPAGRSASAALSGLLAGEPATGAVGRLLATPQTPLRSQAERWRTGLRAAGLEGVVSKRAEESYRPGARSWVKVRQREGTELVLCGLIPHRIGIAGLVLGRFDTRGLSYVGRTLPLPGGLGEPARALLQDLARTDSPFSGRRPGGGRFAGEHDYAWQPLAPLLVVEVEVDGWDGGLIRHRARLVRFRPDRRPEDCREQATGERPRAPRGGNAAA